MAQLLDSINTMDFRTYFKMNFDTFSDVQSNDLSHVWLYKYPGIVRYYELKSCIVSAHFSCLCEVNGLLLKYYFGIL